MKLPNAEIEQAVSPDQSRFTIGGVLLDVEAKKLIATDGHILAVIPADIEDNDHRGIIPTEAMQTARKMSKAAKADATIQVNGKANITAGNQQASFDLETGNFPRYQEVMAKMEGPATVSFNVNLLLRLAKALDNRDASDKRHKKEIIVSLWIKDSQSSIGVSASGSENAGVLMPCRP